MLSTYPVRQVGSETLTHANLGWQVVAKVACCDRVNTFTLKRFLNGGASSPNIVGVYFFLFFLFFLFFIVCLCG